MSAEPDSVAIPDHKILGLLGQGGMARVYLARDEAFDRLVAVKVIDARFAGDVQFQRRFEREAKTAGGLSHPNIVPVHRYGLTADARPYLTMAYLEGGSLRERMRKRGAMSVDEALGIARQIAAALLAAHSRSIVHRDLKPDNVMFHNDTAYLTDFGIAKLLNASTELTGTGLNPGTVRYFSPEQAQEHALDARSDIYALGILLYEMLAGHIPIEADTVVQMIMRIAYSPPQPLPHALRGLQPFMDVLLAKDPADRLGSCQDVVNIIDAMLRNWTRYGDADRLTDGVVMVPSRRASPSTDLDADPGTQASVTAAQDQTVGAANPTRVRAVPANAAQTAADDPSGLTDLGAPTRPMPLVYADARTSAPPAAPAIGTGSRNFLLAAAAVAVLVLVAGGAWWLGRQPASPPASAPDSGLAVAPSADGGELVGAAAAVVPPPAVLPAAADAVAATPSPAPLAGGPGSDGIGAAGAPVTTDVAAPAGVADGTASATGAMPAAADPTVPVVETGPAEAGPPAVVSADATLRITVQPKDARVVLPELKDAYTPGMSLPAGDVLVRLERRGYVTQEERLTLQPGGNSFDRVLRQQVDEAGTLVAPLDPAAAPSNPVSAPSKPVADAKAASPAAIVHAPGEVFRDRLSTGAEGPAMVVVPAGSFRMGGDGADEGPPRNVEIRRPFAVSVHEVTFDDFDRFTRSNLRGELPDEGWGRGTRPVIHVNWDDAVAYAKWLSARTGKRYRLLSEAEWEYVARAGTTSAYWSGDRLPPGGANCADCASPVARQTATVGSFSANRFGVHDILGNVAEWVADCYYAAYDGAPMDATARGETSCGQRVVRGGSHATEGVMLRSAARGRQVADYRGPDVGLRLARDL